MNLVKAGTIVLRFLKRNSPLFLSAAAGIGLAALYILTIKETEEAQEIMQEAEEEEVHSFKMAKKLAAIYAPSFICLVVTMVCIISSALISHHMIRDLTASYAALAAFTNEYRRKQIQEFGEKQDREIVRTIAEEYISDDFPDDEEGMLCFMPSYPSYFYIPEEKYMYEAFLKANEWMGITGSVSLTQWFNWAHAIFYDEKGHECGMNHKYAMLGWDEYELSRSDERGLYPQTEKMELEGGNECTIINVPAPMPLEYL